MKRRRFKVSFIIELDAPDAVWAEGEWQEPDKVTPEALIDHVDDLTWSGGCQHPTHAFFSDRNIEISDVRVRGSRILKPKGNDDESR